MQPKPVPAARSCPEDFDQAARALAVARGVARRQVRELAPNLVLIDCQRRNLLADLVACVDLGSFIELCGEDVDLRRVWSGRTEYRTDWYQPSQGGHTLNAGSTGAGKNSRTSAPIVSIADHERPPAWGPAAVRSSAARPVRGAVILGGCGDRPLRAFRAVGWAVIDG